MGIPGCATCHSNHEILETSDAMLGVGDKAVCGNCHTPQDAGGKTAVAMRNSIESSGQTMSSACRPVEGGK
jgi:nitrate/TMAO reductase-like tetraheme cytochrome c subunit